MRRRKWNEKSGSGVCSVVQQSRVLVPAGKKERLEMSLFLHFPLNSQAGQAGEFVGKVNKHFEQCVGQFSCAAVLTGGWVWCRAFCFLQGVLFVADPCCLNFLQRRQEPGATSLAEGSICLQLGCLSLDGLLYPCDENTFADC